MKQGPKTPNRSRFFNGVLQLALAAIGLVATAPRIASAYTCKNILAMAKLGAPQATPNAGGIKTITIDDLFTFESVMDGMGFLPRKKIIAATPAELSAIVKAVGQDSEALIGVASEMQLYFSALPLSSVGQAFDLVMVRDKFKLHPERVLEDYSTAYNIAFHPQLSESERFAPNTDNGITHEGVVGLIAMQLSSKVLTFDGIKKMMIHIEQNYPEAKRIHQLQALQIFMAMQNKDATATLVAFTNALDSYRDNIAIRKTVVGFNNIDETHPSLADSLMFYVLAGRANLQESEMINLVEQVIRDHRVTSFAEVATVIAGVLDKLDTKIEDDKKKPRALPTSSKKP